MPHQATVDDGRIPRRVAILHEIAAVADRRPGASRDYKRLSRAALVSQGADVLRALERVDREAVG